MIIDRITVVYTDVSGDEMGRFDEVLRGKQEELFYSMGVGISNNKRDDVFDEVAVTVEDEEKLKSEFEFYRSWQVPFDAKAFQHNWSLGSEQEGRVYVGWKHNSANHNSFGTYDLRIEFNPSKQDLDKLETRIIFEAIRLFAVSSSKNLGLYNREILVTMMDLAQDFECDMSCLNVLSKGRKPDTYRGTKYFGKRNTDGYLKAYNKKNEREKKGVKVDSEYLTRIEYKYKKSKDKACTILGIDSIDIDMDKRYQVYRRGELKNVKAEHRACVIAYELGMVNMDEFTRTTQKHIKKIMDDQMERVSLDEMYKECVDDEKLKVVKLLLG